MRRTAAVLVPVLALVGLAGAPSDVHAQQDLAAARACTSIGADAERLACYDRALRGGPAERTQPGRGESPPPAESTASAPTASPPPARSESAAVASSEPPNGRENSAQRKARAADKNEFEVIIVKVDRTRGGGDALFTTDDGRVWRQTDEKDFYPPKPPFHAVISTSRFGSQFLSLPGEHVQIRVFEEQQ